MAIHDQKEELVLSEDKKTLVKCYTLQKQFIVPDTVEIIAEFAFIGSLNLEELILPPNLRKISSGAIYLTSIRELFIPKSVDFIALDAFHDVTTLKSITADKDNVHYATQDNMLFDKNFTTLLALPAENANYFIELPPTVTKITHFAISENRYVAYFKVPDNLEFIPWNIFSGLINLQVLALSENNQNYVLQDNLLLTRDYETLVAYLPFHEDDIVVIPPTVKRILSEAFYRPEYLRHLYLNNALRTIDENAFYFYEEDLKNVYFYYPAPKRHFKRKIKNDTDVTFQKANLIFNAKPSKQYIKKSKKFRNQKKESNIVVHYIERLMSRSSTHTRLNASLLYDEEKIVSSFSFSTAYKESKKKPSIFSRKTTAATVWDGIGGAVFLGIGEAENDANSVTEILNETEARLWEFTSSLSKHRSSKLVKKSHQSIYNDRTTVHYNFANFIIEPFKLNQNEYSPKTPALFIKGVDSAELLIIAKHLLKSVTFVNYMFVKDFNNDTYYTLDFKKIDNSDERSPKSGKTLVFHPHDASFNDLSTVYSHFDCTLIRESNLPTKTLIEKIRKHDKIIIIGRGKGNLLVNPNYSKTATELNPYIINHYMLSLLKHKDVIRIRKSK